MKSEYLNVGRRGLDQTSCWGWKLIPLTTRIVWIAIQNSEYVCCFLFPLYLFGITMRAMLVCLLGCIYPILFYLQLFLHPGLMYHYLVLIFLTCLHDNLRLFVEYVPVLSFVTVSRSVYPAKPAFVYGAYWNICHKTVWLSQ